MELLRRLLNFYPLMTPRASILRRLPPVPAGCGTFRARHGTIDGCHPGRDHISASLYWFGDFDPWVDRTLARLARPGDTVIDVGANIGVTALVLARAVGPCGRVVAFEPHPGNARLLRANLAANGHSMVRVEECALSDAEREVALAEIVGQPGMARIARPGKGAHAVRALPLDAWLECNPRVGSIAVCKIDVEGHEASVLRGMARSLAVGRIEAIVYERHLPAAAGKDEVHAFLLRHGYEVLRIGKSPLGTHYAGATGRLRGRATSDFVAVRPGSLARARLGL